MGCCVCCLNEGQKVGAVLSKFQPVPVRAAHDGLALVVGRVVLANPKAPLFTPADGKMCVWFRLTVEEEQRYEDTSESSSVVRWQQILCEERFADFYLQDGDVKIFVNGANRAQCKVQSEIDVASGASIFQKPPWGIAALFAGYSYKWGNLTNGATGNYRYFQQSFDANELVAGLGVVQAMAADPYSGAPIKQLCPINSNALTPETMNELNWRSMERDIFLDLTRRYPTVMLSDDKNLTNKVPVQPITNLPPWMTQQLRAPPAGWKGYGR
eukprot:gnl/Spiro4/15903_TR8548_c0_g1_i1.p1 gnl/Spiro4/15903_TR8548_c0_g1~~gnl/Spiro4/15903_TR8548_c0_g1_i1.p1  ORF type:complete len:307 (+),score=36.24 gnl/Spiro4/15903_TR8548_c0_g1_i1:113-922(+)